MLTRRSILLALAGGTAALAQPRFRLYARCLPDYLAALARQAYQRREAALAQLKTPDDVRARQQWVRKTLWQLIGGEPERTPLLVHQTGGFARDGYRVQLLVYESRTGVRIPANLYLPDGAQPPFPAVLFQMGHSLNGKANDTYQKACQALVRLGYVVLAFDPFGQGERTYYKAGDADEEHSRLGRQLLLSGDSATRLQLWDAVRSLDVLWDLPMVDRTRIASMGQSGGATLTMFLAAVDSRLACAVVSCGNTENFACDGFNPPGSTDDAEQNLIGSGPLGFDRWDLLYPLAPKPLLLLVSERDSFGTYSPSYLQSGLEEFEKLRRVYALLGAADRLEWGATALPHALAPELRLQSYRFLERWLHSSTRLVSEPPVQPEPDLVLVAGVQPALPPAAPVSPAPLDAAALRTLLGLGSAPSAKLIVLARDRALGCEVETCEVASAPGVVLPAYVFNPSPVTPLRSALLLLDPAGRTRHWREGDLCQNLAAAGHLVCAFDVRGIGDLTPELGRGNSFYNASHSSEEAYAWASLILGHPLLAQRVDDILAMSSAVRQRVGRERPLVLAASGHMTLPALCATALDSGLAVAYLARGLVSWASLLAGDSYTEPFSSFLPGVLTRTDLPFIARLVAPRRVILAGPVDANGQPVAPGLVRALYEDSVEVRPDADWTERVLTGLGAG
ncbi:MAG TPA: acetylxylan esterase [Candidatus Limnocylindrales bacterium]|jgi:dienelactone hydrolase